MNALANRAILADRNCMANFGEIAYGHSISHHIAGPLTRLEMDFINAYQYRFRIVFPVCR